MPHLLSLSSRDASADDPNRRFPDVESDARWTRRQPPRPRHWAVEDRAGQFHLWRTITNKCSRDNRDTPPSLATTGDRRQRRRAPPQPATAADARGCRRRALRHTPGLSVGHGTLCDHVQRRARPLLPATQAWFRVLHRAHGRSGWGVGERSSSGQDALVVAPTGRARRSPPSSGRWIGWRARHGPRNRSNAAGCSMSPR